MSAQRRHWASDLVLETKRQTTGAAACAALVCRDPRQAGAAGAARAARAPASGTRDRRPQSRVSAISAPQARPHMPRAQRAPHPSWPAPYPASGGPGMQAPMHTSTALPRSRTYYPQAPQQYPQASRQAAAPPVSHPGYNRFADPYMQSAHYAPKPGMGPGQGPSLAAHRGGVPAQHPASASLGAAHPGAGAGGPAAGVRFDAPPAGTGPAGPLRYASDPRGTAIPPVTAAGAQFGAGRAPHGPFAAQTPAYGGDPHSQAHAPAIASRIASANAAIAAIQSVAPPLVSPMPSNKPTMALLGLPQLPGGDLKGTIKFDHDEATKVVDEVTAQKSAAEFSSTLGKARRARREQWDDFWRHRLDLNRRILVLEDECFNEAQEDAAENEYSDDEDVPRRVKPVTVPYIYHNTGSFDIPPGRPVIMPDPEAVMLQVQHAQAQQAHLQQAQANSHQAQQLRVQQAQVQAQRSALSARQRAAQQVKPFRNY